MHCSTLNKIKVLQYIKHNKDDIEYIYYPLADIKRLSIKNNDKKIFITWETNPSNNGTSLHFMCNLCDNKMCESNPRSQRKNILEKLFVRKIVNKMSMYHTQKDNQKSR